MSHNGSPTERTLSGSTSWRLPSGKALGEFALQAGFLAPLLFKTKGFANAGLPKFHSESGNHSSSFKKSSST